MNEWTRQGQLAVEIKMQGEGREERRRRQQYQAALEYVRLTEKRTKKWQKREQRPRDAQMQA